MTRKTPVSKIAMWLDKSVDIILCKSLGFLQFSERSLRARTLWFWNLAERSTGGAVGALSEAKLEMSRSGDWNLLRVILPMDQVPLLSDTRELQKTKLSPEASHTGFLRANQSFLPDTVFVCLLICFPGATNQIHNLCSAKPEAQDAVGPSSPLDSIFVLKSGFLGRAKSNLLLNWLALRTPAELMALVYPSSHSKPGYTARLIGNGPNWFWNCS